MYLQTLIVILLTSCTQPVLNPEQATVLITDKSRVIKTEELIIGQQNDLTFAFIPNESKGLDPRFYYYGNIKLTTIPEIKPGDFIEPYKTYVLRYQFKKPGKASLLFLWESKNHFSVPTVIHLQNE